MEKYRGPVPVIGPDVAEQIRGVLNPSGHLDLAVLQDIRAVFPLAIPPGPKYIRACNPTAVAGEVPAVLLGVPSLQIANPQNPLKFFRLRRLVWSQASAAVINIRAVATSVLPTGATIRTGLRMDNTNIQSQTSFTFGTLAAPAGAFLAQIDVPALTTFVLDFPDGLVSRFIDVAPPPVQSFVALSGSVVNESCRISMIWDEVDAV